jgi:CRISPR-associated endonuclease Cas2
MKILEKKQIIYLEENGNEVFVHIHNKGELTLLKYSIKSLLNFKRRRKMWQRKWYVVFFDVPEIQRNKRDYLRRFLLKLGFYRYQKSVYLFPYECEKEINLIKKIVEGAKYINYIVAEKIENEEQAKIFFNLP